MVRERRGQEVIGEKEGGGWGQESKAEMSKGMWERNCYYETKVKKITREEERIKGANKEKERWKTWGKERKVKEWRGDDGIKERGNRDRTGERLASLELNAKKEQRGK